jgi:cell division protein FtsL
MEDLVKYLNIRIESMTSKIKEQEKIIKDLENQIKKMSKTK